MNSKLEELILYIADASETDPHFGMVKLNKILFDADFTSFGRRGHSITGEDYQKLPQGPASRRLKPCVEKAQQRGELVIKTRPAGLYEQQRIIALREPKITLFEAEEIALVEESIQRFWGMTASQVSALSHEFMGWKLVGMFESIPYGWAFIDNRELTAEEYDYAMTIEKAI